MKKFGKMLLLTGVLLTFFAVTAFAADDQSGIKDVTVENGYTEIVSLQPQKADGTAITEVEGFYANAEKVKVTYSGATNASFYLVLAMTDETGVPTEANLAYINQDSAANGSVSFTVYPNSLTSGTTYNLYLSSNASSGIKSLTKVASFLYYAPYTLGNVDMSTDQKVTSNDAMLALQMAVGLSPASGGEWTETQRLAANVDKVANVTANDAMMILQRAVGLRDEDWNLR